MGHRNRPKTALASIVSGFATEQLPLVCVSGYTYNFNQHFQIFRVVSRVFYVFVRGN